MFIHVDQYYVRTAQHKALTGDPRTTYGSRSKTPALEKTSLVSNTNTGL